MRDDTLVRELVASALAVPESQRAGYLEEACTGDQVLRAEVESLLLALKPHGNPLEGATAEGSPFALDAGAKGSGLGRGGLPQTNAAVEGPGAVIGVYKLLQVIGEGGFGTVYMAEQQRPVMRRVALKIIKLGMDTRQVIARFEAERQALAMMDHPNIAKVLDAGTTDAGRPFFVMELVSGDPITQYCDQNHMAVEERLELFGQVCRAVQHAHQKGIIHRDIKPTNVLVSTQDGRAHARVIDFGIAKATAVRLTEKTLFTEHKAMIGTPAYMSPEQAGGNLDIDTRTDVYALGVLLYELLTGTTPFDAQELRSAAFAEIERIIREVEPPKPSTRISTLGDTLPSVAASRRLEPKGLGSLVRGELDWIVMKALEKDRARRYETANGLLMDVQRYLAGEPVLAAPPSAVYRLRNFVRRYRGAVLAGSLVATALLAGTGIAVWQAVLATRAQTRSLASAESERKAKETAVIARRDAEQRQRETQQVADFQEKMLSDIDVAAMGRGIVQRLREQVRAGLKRETVGEWPNRRPLTLAEVEAGVRRFDEAVSQSQPVDVARGVMDEYVLRRGVSTVRKDFAGQPRVKAQLSEAIATAYQSLGLYDAAEPLFREELALCRSLDGGEHLGVVRSLTCLASLLQDNGNYAAAEPFYREALAMCRKLRGNEHLDVATNLCSLSSCLQAKGDYAAAEPLCRESLGLRRKLLGNEHPDVATSMNSLAVLLEAKGDYAAAEPLFRDAVVLRRKLLGDEHLDVATSLANLASLLQAKADYASAEPLCREALAMRRKLLGNEHRDVAASLSNLGGLLYAKGDYVEAEALLREALALDRKLLGNEHPAVATSLNNLAALLGATGDYASAEPLYREALALYRKVLGNRHPAVVKCLNNLGGLLCAKGDYVVAEALLREALALRRELNGNEHPDVATSLNNLAELLRAKGDSAGAEPLYREALALCRRVLGDEHPNVATTLDNLAMLLESKGDYAAAEPLYIEGVAICRKVFHEPHPLTAMLLYHLAGALHAQRKTAQAEPPAREAVQMYRSHLTLPDDDAAHAFAVLAGILAADGEGRELAQETRSELERVRRAFPPADPRAASALALRGELLLRERAYAAAEPMLRECLAIRSRAFTDGDPQAWSKYNTMSMLGEAIVGRVGVHAAIGSVGDLREAEQLLLDGYEGMKDDPRLPRPARSGAGDRKREALERILGLYETWNVTEPGKGYDAKASEWRARLAALKAATQPAPTSAPGSNHEDEAQRSP